MDPRNPHGYTGRTLGSRPSQHGHPPPPQQHPPPQYGYGYSSPYGQPAPNYPPQQPYAYPPYGAPAHSAPPPPAPGYGYYPQPPPQQHSYHQPPPGGYGHAPQGGPTHDAPLPPQYAAHAPGPPAAGYVQPANPPHAIYGNHSQTSTVSVFRSTGQKRALLIGINYSGSAKLNGCVRDVTYMTHLLRTKFGFRDSDFYIMTDKPSGIQNVRTGTPTRRGILEAMRWLVSGAQPGDSLFFHFSGHGSQVKDTSGDEADGYDETILPMDYQKAGHIVDDEIYDIMVRRLPRGARLTAVMDCCHSGTGMDLPYIHDASGYGSGMALDAPARPSTTGSLFSIAGSLLSGKPSAAMSQGLQLAGFGRKKKKIQGRPKLPDPDAGEVLLFSGCRDNEVAADTSALAGVVTGAMTYCVIEAIENGSVRDWRSYTYRSLLHAMREKLRAAKLKQIPQFSTSHPFDLSSPFII